MSLGQDGDTAGGKPATQVERLTEFNGADLHDLCDAAEAAIVDGGGFGWLTPPTRMTEPMGRMVGSAATIPARTATPEAVVTPRQ